MVSDPIERLAPDEAAQLAWGAALGAVLMAQPDAGARRGHDAAPGGALVFLEGDLGAGKTTLVRGLLRGLGHRGPVRSPTYTLVETYELPGALVHHLDLYRIADPEELEYLGIRDLLDGNSLVLVEWPERGAGVLPAPDIRVHIEHLQEGRRLGFDAKPAWATLLRAGLPKAPPPAPVGD
jgi:tRNA threonylcarbamoyladenosine biosynthesis protein TsaE